MVRSREASKHAVLLGYGDVKNFADGVVERCDAALGATLGPLGYNHFGGDALKFGAVGIGGFDQFHVAFYVMWAGVCTGVAVVAFLGFLSRCFPDFVVHDGKVGFQELLHFRVQAVPVTLVNSMHLLVPVDGQGVQVGADFIPLGRVDGHGAGNRAVDNGGLQGGYHLAKRDGYAAAANGFHKFGLGAAAGAYLLAFQVGQTVDFGIAEHDLCRVGGKAQYFDVVVAVILLVDGQDRKSVV